MAEKTPQWAKKLSKDVSNLSKDVNELKKQTLTNCSKLTTLDKKISKELPHLRIQINTLCGFHKNTETHLNRIENKVNKIESRV